MLSAVEDRMDELGASIAQSRRTVALVKVRLGPNPLPLQQATRLVRSEEACAQGSARCH